MSEASKQATRDHEDTAAPLDASARTVGLSGGIGSGKSTVSAIFEELGAALIDADAIVHELQAPGMPLLAELARAFGDEILTESGALDRARLGDLVFRDEEQRRRLGQLVHPAVGAEMARRTADALDSAVPLVILDIPLLFEGRKANTGTAARMGYDTTVLVWVPRALQIERTMERDGCDGRGCGAPGSRAQLPIDEKRELADHVIDNSGALSETRTQVEVLFELLVEARGSRPQNGAR